MRGLMRMIAAAMAAMRTVWVKCMETGQLIATTVFGGGGGAPLDVYDDEVGEAAGALEPQAGLSSVRELAAAISNGCVQPEMLEAVNESTFAWLSVLDRSMIASILLADDATLRAHMRGQRTIRGVVQADAESVAGYRAALDRKNFQHDAELDYVPGLAFA